MSEAKPKVRSPSVAIIAEIAEHFEGYHEGKDTRPPPDDPVGEPPADLRPRELYLQMDIAYPGNPRSDAIFTYFRSEEEGEGYYCGICHGRLLPKKIPYGSPERNAAVRLRHPEIFDLARKIKLEDLSEATPEQLIAARQHLEDVTESFDRGHYADALRVQVARAEQRKTKAKGRDPRAAARIENAKAFMLEAYAVLGNREEVWDELDELRVDNLDLYKEIIGDGRVVPDSTKSRWWEETDEEDRAAAKALYNERPEVERKREAAERRARKVRG